mgnify:FL=1
MRKEELKKEIRSILEQSKIVLGDEEIDKIVELATKLKVQKRQDVLRNFLSAYLRVYHNLTAKDVNTIASSPKGRRKWEEKIRAERGDGNEVRGA